MKVHGLTTFSKAPNLASDPLWTALTPCVVLYRSCAR